MNNAYQLTVRTGNPIPRDVLVEHLAVALKDLKFLGGFYIHVDSVQEEPVARQHPFEGPEVFDDEPKPTTAHRFVPWSTDGGALASDSVTYPYPNVAEAAFQLREARNGRRGS